MKKIVLFSFALALAFTVRAQHQTVTIDFQVDMTTAILGDPCTSCGHVSCDSPAFNPSIDVVQLMGGLINGWFDWQAPPCGGSWVPDDTTDFVPVSPGSLVYHKVYTIDTMGGTQLQYKFRIDHSWDNDELRGSGDAVCAGSGNRCFILPDSPDSASITALSTFMVPGETITVGISGVKNLNAPKVNSLYPNPANGKASLVYTTNSTGKVQIYLTNLVGQSVKTVFNGSEALGVHTQSINVTGLANGVYFLTLKVNNQSVVRKFNVMN